MPNGLLNVLLLVPVFLFSLCVHEFAHGWVASLCGDPTPEESGRLTLHPMAHADLWGTLLIPIICIYNGWPFIGWAKPVPVDVTRMKRGRTDMALVAAAGPASNLILALLSTAFLGVRVRLPLEHNLMETLQTFSVVSIQVNLMLAFFNLIPLPPLDGFNVLQGFLPVRAVVTILRYGQHAHLILFVLLFTGGLRFILAPVQIGFRYLVGLVT